MDFSRAIPEADRGCILVSLKHARGSSSRITSPRVVSAHAGTETSLHIFINALVVRFIVLHSEIEWYEATEMRRGNGQKRRVSGCGCFGRNILSAQNLQYYNSKLMVPINVVGSIAKKYILCAFAKL